MKGPLEGGKGMAQGTGSLIKNTLVGTFNTVSTMTGSMASGLSYLTLVIF